MAIRIITLVCLLILGASPAWAQDRIKKSLFDDCDAAKLEFSQLSREQREPLLHFFTRVIGLSTQSPSAPEAFAVLPGAPKSGDVGHLTGGKAPDMAGALWQTTDAKRELRGKRCALELLQSAGAEALAVLPALVRVYSEQPLSDEIAVHLEETAALIAEQAHKQGLSPSSSQFDEIAPHLLSSRPLIAQNTLQEFLALATPRVLLFASTHSDTENKVITDFLHTVDQDGSRAYRAFIDLVPTLTEPQLRRLSETLPLPSAASMSAFVPDLARFLLTPERASVFLPVVAKICTLSGGIKLDSILDPRVSPISVDSTLRNLPVEQAACLISSSPALGRSYAGLFAGTQPTSTMDFALSLLPLTHKSLSAESRSQVLARLKDMALAPTIPIAAQATNALRFFPERRADSIVIAGQNIKRGFELKDPSQRDLLVQAAFSLITALGAQREGVKFVAAISRALETNVARTEAEALSVQIPEMENRLTMLARNRSNSAAQLAALRALSNRTSITKQSVASLAELLNQREFQDLAAQALARGGSAAAPTLRRIAARAGESTRRSALSALALSNTISKQEIPDLISLLHGEDCGHIEDSIDLLCSSALTGDHDLTEQEKLSSILNRCVASFSVPHQKALAGCNPSALLTSRPGLVTIAKNSTSIDFITPVLSRLVRSAPSTDRDSTTAALLAEASDPVREQLVTLLSEIRDVSSEVRAAVRTVATTTGIKSPALYFAAIKALSSIGDSEFGWQAFLQQAIEMVGRGEYRERILPIVTQLPSDLVLQAVVPNLDSEAPERLIGASLVGAALGTKAIPIVSKVWHLREKRSPAVRYTATLALLRINPLTPDISEFVERVLVNRYYPLALELPINWAQTVAVVDLDKSSFGTLRTVRLEQLLTSGPQR